MRKIIKIGNKVTVFLDSGDFFEGELSSEDFDKVRQAKTDEEVLKVISPGYKEALQEREDSINLIEKLKKCSLFTVYNNTVYWEEVSPLSVPVELAEAVYNAHQSNDEDKLTAYKNFWTLMSLNPDERCRINLFWFLKKYGLTIAKCGFFVGYRNVDTTEEEGVYTDHHSHRFKIKIGKMVTMDRSKCDDNQEHECSSGLHIAGQGWLKRNYYGNVGMACLVNPADVVAVPHNSDYGKLRTCAYLPIKEIHYDEQADVIPLDVEDGFECKYVTKVIYEGTMGTEEDSPYRIKIPEIPGMSKASIEFTLLNIAKKCITDRML